MPNTNLHGGSRLCWHLPATCNELFSAHHQLPAGMPRLSAGPARGARVAAPGSSPPPVTIGSHGDILSSSRPRCTDSEVPLCRLPDVPRRISPHCPQWSPARYVLRIAFLAFLWLFPKITSKRNDLYPDLCLRVCFRGSPKEEKCVCRGEMQSTDNQCSWDPTQSEGMPTTVPVLTLTRSCVCVCLCVVTPSLHH